MSVIFKLIGCGGSNPPELKKDFSDTIGLKDIYPIFEKILDSSELSNIKFIANQITLKDDIKLEISSDKIITMYVFTSIQEIKMKLLKFFKNNNEEELDEDEDEDEDEKPEDPSKTNILKNIDVIEEKKPILDDETVLKINKKTIELFNKPNFKILLNIWLNEPSIFSDFFPYINKGDIVNINVPEESKDKMFENEIKYLNEIGINKSPEIMRDILRKYNGVLNFTIREILPSIE